MYIAQYSVLNNIYIYVFSDSVKSSVSLFSLFFVSRVSSFSFTHSPIIRVLPSLGSVHTCTNRAPKHGKCIYIYKYIHKTQSSNKVHEFKTKNVYITYIYIYIFHICTLDKSCALSCNLPALVDMNLPLVLVFFFCTN